MKKILGWFGASASAARRDELRVTSDEWEVGAMKKAQGTINGAAESRTPGNAAGCRISHGAAGRRTPQRRTPRGGLKPAGARRAGKWARWGAVAVVALCVAGAENSAWGAFWDSWFGGGEKTVEAVEAVEGVADGTATAKPVGEGKGAARADPGDSIYTSGTPSFGSSYSYGNKTLNSVAWYFSTCGNNTSMGWNKTSQNYTGSATMGVLANITQTTKIGAYQTSGAFANAQKITVTVANSDNLSGTWYIWYSTDGGSTWTLATSNTLSSSTTSFTYDHGSKIGDSVMFAFGYGVTVTTKTRIALSGIQVWSAAASSSYSTADRIIGSYIVFNGGWYNGSNTDSGKSAFNGHDFGAQTAITLGAQAQTYGDNNAADHIVEFQYSVYASGGSASSWNEVDMAWFQYNSNNNWFRTGTAYNEETVDIANLAAGNYKLAVYFKQQTGASSWIYDSNNSANYVADFSVAATLTRTPTSLSGFSTTAGTASAAQSFSVTATHLNGDLTVTPPTGYEVSKTSGTTGFGNSVTLTRDANNKVTAQTVYVRLKSSASAGTYNGNLTVSGGGTTQVTVALTGSVAAAVPEIDVEASHAFGTMTAGQSKTETVTVNNTGTGALSISGVTFSGTGNGYFSVSPTTATVAAGGSQNLLVTFAPTVSGSYSVTMNIANNDSDENPKGVTLTATVKPVALTLGAAAGAAPGTVTLTVSGRESDATVNVRRYDSSTAADNDTAGTGGTQVTAANANGTFTDSGLDGCKTYYYKAWQTRNSQTSAATDTKSAKTALATPDVWSTADDGSITLNWPPVKGAVNYTVEIATDDTFATGGSGGVSEGFDAGSSVPDGWAFSSGSVGGTYTSGGNYGVASPSWQIKANATWTTPTFSSPTEVSFWYKGNGGTTSTLEIQQLVSGSWLSIETVNVPSTGTTYSHSLNAAATQLKFIFTKNAGNLALDDVTVTCSSGGGTMMAGYPVTVAQPAAGVTNVTHSLSGLTNEVTYSYRVTANGAESCEMTSSIGHEEPTAVTPTLTVGTLSGAMGTTTYGTEGTVRTFTVSGSDLGENGTVTVDPPAGYKVSVDGSTWGGDGEAKTLTANGSGVLASTTVRIRLSGASVGTFNGNVSVTSGTASETVSVSGTVTAVAPTVGNPTYASVTVNSATLGGKVTANGGAALTSGGVRYRESGTTAWTTVAAGSVPTVGTAFTVSVTGLQPGKTYEFQAYAGNGTQTGYTASGTFTTLRPTLTVSPESVTGMTATQYQEGTPVNVTVSGGNLMGNVTVTASAGFEVSTDGGSTWGSSGTITASGTLNATTVKVRIAEGSTTGAVSGSLTVTSSNATTKTVTLSGSVAEATVDTGSWLGDSRLVLNGDWYKGTATEGSDPAVPATLGYLTTLTLGGHVQTYGQNNGALYPAYMTYSIDGGAESTVSLIWYKYGPANNWFGMGGDASQGQNVQTATELDLSGLPGGSHTLTVYFWQPTSVGSGTLYDAGSTRRDFSITFVTPAWSGPNTVYWRNEAVDGHFVRQDGDGNHDPWQYQITPTVGFHNPNMTDYGPNRVIIDNNNQRMMTNDVASTVESFSFIAGDGLTMAARTNWGTATLTVNSAITNTAAQLVFRMPVALGGNVKVYNTNATYFLGGLNGSGKTLTKTGAGTVYISSAATLGSLVVTTGHVQLNTGGSLSGNASVASSRSLRTNPSSGNTVNYGGVLSGAGYFLKQGAGTTTLSGDNTYSGKTSVTNGTLIAGHANALGTGPVYVGGSSAKLQIGVASVSVKSVNFSGANSVLLTGRDKVLASTQNAIINNVTFDAGSYSGDDAQWAIVTSSSGTITLNGTLTVQNAPATGSFALELSGDSKTLYVTYHKPPAAPSLTVSTVTGNGGQLSGTATPPSGASVVVVRYASASYGTPTGTSLPSLNADWAGGKVVSVTSGAFTDTGLTGCTTYYYKAWSLKNGLWSTDGTTGSAATDTVAAPVLNALSDVTYQGFTASWAVVPGASTYRMDITKGGGSGAAILSADFADEGLSTESSYPSGEQTRTFSGMTWSTTAVMTKPEGSSNGSGSTGFLQMQANNGIIVLPTLNGVKTVKVVARGGNTLKLQRKVNGAWDTENPLETWSLTSSGTEFTHTFASAQDGISLRIVGDTANAKYVHDVTVLGEGTTPVAGWTDRDVSSLMTVAGGVVSVEVAGLAEETTYSVTVRAEGATAACKSDDSNTESATTLQDTSLANVTIANYDADGEGAGSNVAAGNVAAGQTVLVQGTKLTVASGSVNPTLSGVTFRTAGTAGTGDVDSYQVRVGTSPTFAGTETAKGTVACSGAAASHTVTFGTAQTLTAGGTYYVWIEAVTKADATGGNTVGVAALTTEAFSMTAARPSGGTTATGLQTIGNLTAFSAATGATAGGQIGLTWTAGASGTMTVRWSTSDNIPGPGTAWANETTGLTGGTHTLTGLAGCQGYYLKAWEVVGGVACGGVRTGTATASAPAAPTGLNHGTPGAHEATLTWTAGAGAAGYSVDVWHYEGGGVSGIAGAYTLITSADDLADGNYVFVETKNGTGAMNNVNTSSRLYPVSVTEMLSGDGNTTLTLTDTEANSNIVWKLTYDSTAENWTIQSVGNSQYVSWSSGNTVVLEDSLTDNYDRWTLVFSDGLVKPTNVGDSSRMLQFNNTSGNDFFACYTSAQAAMRLYKQTGGSGTKFDDVIANATAPEASAECTVSGTGATLTHLTDGTTYYWTVKSLGEGGCAGGTSGQDSFTTAELLGVPVIGTLTADVEELSGRVTGTAGATLVLKRYESEEAALAGTAAGLDGVNVSSKATETGTGTGVWDFTDDGLDGCTTYYYRAWQRATVDGESATSGGSNVASGKTDLAEPTVTAAGAGTQMTISWQAVPGATSYKVQLSDTEGVWTATAGGEGSAVLDEAFAGFTATSSTDISGSLNTYTEETGWTGSKVYCNSGEAKLGSSSAVGELVTPTISAMPHGGKVYFDLRKYNDDTGNLKVEQSFDGGASWSLLKSFTPTEDWQTGLQAAIPEGTTSFKLHFITTTKRAYIDNVRVVPLSAVAEGTGRGLIYESTVTSAPWSRIVTDLEVGALYYYRVIVTGAEDCETSAGSSASTANAPMIEVVPGHYNFGTVTKDSGEHTADFVVWNTGNEPLKFSAVTLVQDGDAYSITAPASGLTADLAAGQSRTYTVKFNPQSSGPQTATLRFVNDAYNVTGEVPPASGTPTYGNTDIALSGSCFDPATADPEVLRLEVTDGLGVTNTVWDDSLANSASQPVLSVVAYHFNGIDWDSEHQSRATWTLYNPAGTAVRSGQSFTSMEAVEHDGRSCVRLSAPIPALGAANTALGTWSVGVTLKASNLTESVTTRVCVPAETGRLLDDFTRPDAVGSGGGALGNGWTAMASDGEPGSAAIRGAALELYGPGGRRTEMVAGRVAAARDMSGERYPTTWKDFTGAGSWGFHFKTGAKTVSWANGSTAGAFVLGATHSTWFTSDNAQKGVAVMLTNDSVRLVRFEKSLLEGGTIADLTTASYSGTQGKWLAVRVDYIPGQPEVDAEESDDGQYHAAVPAKMRLFVKEVAGPGGNPVVECGNADLVEMVDVGDTVSGDLKYGGAVWNHGTAQLSETTGGTFDDVYVPHMDGQTEPMEFRVIDEDTEGPEFYGFSIRGAIAAPTVATSGLTVTGMVHDASGLSGTVGYKMYNGETLLTSGTMTAGAVSGSSTEFTLTCTINSGVIDGNIRSSDCRFEVTAADGDADRSEDGTNVDAAEGTGVFPFTFCANTPTAPTWATAEIDGAEMVVLRWARTAGSTYVVVRSDEEIGENASPQGRTGEGSMAEGTTVAGWGKVVYNGTGDNHLTGSWTAREFIVEPGSTNYFAVYGMTGDETTGFYFSAPTIPNAYAWATTNSEGVVTHHTATESDVPVASEVTEGAWPCVTPKYEPGEGVDAFEYRTSVTVPGDDDPEGKALAFSYETRPETGSGWGGAWTGDTGTWKVHDGGLLVSGTGYPAPVGNKLFWEDTSSSSAASATLTRTLKTPNTAGHFFVAGMLNYGGGLDASMFDTAGTWVTLALVDGNGDVLVSFGKQGGGTCKDATMQVPVGQFGITGSAGEYRNTTGNNADNYMLNPGHGQDYIIAGEVDRENKTLRMWVFYGGEGSAVEIPQVYNDPDNTIVKPSALESVQASWSWASTAPNWAGQIAGIRLIAGSDGSHQLGHVYFDEIRFAQSWPELFLFNDPEVYTFDFDKPVDATGNMVGTDTDGHRLWEVSDGALAHGDVGLNAQFGLYHRTGISSASFTIKDADGNAILKSVGTSDNPSTPRDERLALDSDETGHVALSGRTGAAYSDWKTTSAPNVPGGATGVAIPTNRISLDATYTVEVTLTSAGGREATVTSASETGGGGATDLFFGEYGEGDRWDKYVEIYNGTGHDVDLTQYYLVRLAKDQDFSTYYGKTLGSPACERLFPEGSTDPNHILPHGKTIVLLLDAKIGGTGEDHTIYLNRLAAMQAALTRSNCLFHVMGTSVLDAGGDTAYLLITKEAYDNPDADGNNAGSAYNKAWIDACGLAQGVVGRTTGKYIMSRKDTAVYLPRKAPDIIDESEWDYRDWGLGDDDDYDQYGNFISTAGWNDRQLGLGGNMEFKVFDDDTEAPVLRGGGVSVGGTRRAAATGERVYVMGAWNFTNYPTGTLTQADYERMSSMWSMGMTTNGGISWSPLLGDGLADVLEAKSGSGQSHVDFDGLEQVAKGDLLIKSDRDKFSQETEVWLGFDLDVSKLSDAVLTFGYAGGPSGFQNGRVEVSTTGLEDSFKMPNGWNFLPQSGTNATTWTEWSGDLADAVAAVPEVATAGHLWFRVVLKDYKSSGGTFRMDNIRLEGAPEAVRVSDAELRTQDVEFDAHVLDEASGLDAGTATFEYGVAGVTLTKSQTLNNGGKSESTFTWSKTGGFEKAKVQEWYTNSLAGKTQLRVTISDKDDDRPGDALEMSSSYGLLDVYDDDAEPPVLEMETMKPRKEGVFAEWKPKEKTQTPSETMEGLDVGALELCTTAGRTSKPRYAGMGDGDAKTYALYANGWQAGSKYWTTTISNSLAGEGAISKISFQSKVGNALAPTGFRVEYGTVAHGAATAVSTDPAGSGSLLTTGDAWSKENDEETAGGSPIKTWKDYELEFATPIPLAAAGAEGDMIELRIFGTGADPDGIGAYWYLWDLTLEGEISLAEDGYTYVTDDSLAGGTTLALRGSVYDEVSGLLSAPTYALTNKANNQVVSSGTISFSEEKDLSARKTKDDGGFSQEISVSALGYGVQLAEYKGGIHAEDADDDRGTSGEDKLSLDAQFAFTVVDQDVKGPTAPGSVTVNGTAVPNEQPNRNNVTWTNNPEFVIGFNVAHDQVPTSDELASADWKTAHGVKDTTKQNKATGVGEYRVALATDAASMSNAPAFSVAATNGALANYGFERGNAESTGDIGWTNPDGDSGIHKGNNVGGSYPVAEGTNSYYLRANAAASQIIPFAASDSEQTLTVDLSLKIFKRAAGSIVYAKFEFSADEESWTSAISDVGLNSGASGDPQNEWLSKTMTTKTLTAPAGAKYLRFSLRMNANTANIDDVRLSVRVGAAPAAGTADRATMRYVADAAAQGLNVKYLFAADADNNRPQDRMLGETAAFYTAYDCTPPTAIGKSEARLSANPTTTDDPTTQFDLSWSNADVGPDDTNDANYQKGWSGSDVLSPWETYKFYFHAYEPTEWRLEDNTETDGTGPTSRSATRDGGESDPVANYINTRIIATRAYTNSDWSSVTRYSEIADQSVKTNYSSLGLMTTHSNRLYDLENDREYVVVIVGVDAAGNEGPANQYSWATNNTIKFAITQGVMRAEADIPQAWRSGLNGAKRAAALYWTASAQTSVTNQGGVEVTNHVVNREYALIYRDARTFSESSNNTWTAVGTVQSNWFVDAGALTKEASNIRFYRAAYKDRWKDKVEVSTSGRRGETEVVTQRPLMSEDVYAMTAVPLVSNANYVTLHGFGVANGETNTLGAIFGTDPSVWRSVGPDGVNLDVYTAGFTKAQGVNADHTYYLHVDENGKGAWWRLLGQQDGKDWTHYVDEDIFRHGVSIKMPEITEPDLWVTNNGGRQPAVYWHPVLLVPTNSVVCQSVVYDNEGKVVSSLSGPKEVNFSVPVFAGSNRADVVWNFCSFTLPVAFHPSQLGLEADGFVPSTKPTLTPDCDILYAYDSVTKSLRHGSGMFLGPVSSTDSNLVWRSILGNHAVVTGKPFYPNDVLVINSRSSATATDGRWTWTYHPTNYYSPPTRWGGW